MKLQLLFMLLTVFGYAQVGIGTETPESGAILELKSDDKSFLLPRLNDENSITNPVDGMIYYDKNLNSFRGRANGVWVDLAIRTTDVSNPGDDGDATFDSLPTVRVVSVSDSDLAIDIQGVMDNDSNQVVFNVPYTDGDGSYDAYTSTAVAVTGEGGDSNNLTISYPAGSFSDTGTIQVTVTVDGDGSFDVTKQALETTDTFATLDFQVNGSSKGDVKLDAAGGIPDRAFGDGVHDFIYLSVVGEDGKTWLNNNLGAHYAQVNHDSFNPAQQGTAFNDHLAYGSLYQWGRLSDGHELIEWTGATTGTAENGTTTTPSTSDTPGNPEFIVIVDGDWRNPKNDNLWQGKDGINNPCPVGYRLPTHEEYATLVTEASISDYTDAAKSNLAFTTAGVRVNSSGELFTAGSTGYYWVSTVSDTEEDLSRHRRFYNNGTAANSSYRPYGYSVRCLKD